MSIYFLFNGNTVEWTGSPYRLLSEITAGKLLTTRLEIVKVEPDHEFVYKDEYLVLYERDDSKHLEFRCQEFVLDGEHDNVVDFMGKHSLKLKGKPLEKVDSRQELVQHFLENNNEKKIIWLYNYLFKPFDRVDIDTSKLSKDELDLIDEYYTCLSYTGTNESARKTFILVVFGINPRGIIT